MRTSIYYLSILIQPEHQKEKSVGNRNVGFLEVVLYSQFPTFPLCLDYIGTWKSIGIIR